MTAQLYWSMGHMRKEEKVIKGVLHWRGSPTGKFKPYTVEELSQKVANYKTELYDLGCVFQDLKLTLITISKTALSVISEK